MGISFGDLAIFFLLWVGPSVGVGYMWRVRGKSMASGIFWSILLSPIIGAIIVSLASGRRTCPFCREGVNPKALVCKHCHKDLPVAA